MAHPFYVWTIRVSSSPKQRSLAVRWACEFLALLAGQPALFGLLSPLLCAQSYSSATIVNAASGQPVLAPNTFMTIYGKDFSLEPRSMAGADIQGGELPLTLPGTGVRVTVEGVPAPIWYVSPTQINFLVPSLLVPKRDAALVVTVFGRTGPEVNVNLAAESPGLFQADPETPVVVRLSGIGVTSDKPAARGDEVLLYATGLGRTDPDTEYRQVAKEPGWLVKRGQFRVLLNGEAVADRFIRYVGVAPGFAGLYQINLVIPDNAPAFPSIQVAIGEARSQPGLRLPVR